MCVVRPFLAGLLLAMTGVAAVAADDSGAIRGVVELRDGRTIAGGIVWGRNGRFWNQRLRAVYDEPLQTGETTESVELFGMKLWSWKEKQVLQLGLAVPFGLIESIEPEDGETCVLVLAGGERLRVRGNGRDVGSGAEIVVLDGDGKEHEVAWRRVERVRFEPVATDDRAERRLFGTVTTTAGEFRGFVAWDRDEVLLDESLDGDEGSLTFDEIAEIRRAGSGASTILRRDGEELRLTGTNDVNDENRGIEVTVDGVGVVLVAWDAFESFRLEPPPPSPPRSSFHPGPIAGVVVTRDGDEHRGEIVWGGHERHLWEAIDAELEDDVDLSAPFDRLAAVEFDDGTGAVLVFRDGARRRVRGDDVAPQTVPIEIATGAGRVRVDWGLVREVRFDPAP